MIYQSRRRRCRFSCRFLDQCDQQQRLKDGTSEKEKNNRKSKLKTDFNIIDCLRLRLRARKSLEVKGMGLGRERRVKERERIERENSF